MPVAETIALVKTSASVVARLASYSYEQLGRVERERLRKAIRQAFFVQEGVRGTLFALVQGKQVPLATIQRHVTDFGGMPTELAEDLKPLLEIGRRGTPKLTVMETDTLVELYYRKRDIRSEVVNVMREQMAAGDVGTDRLEALLAAIDEFNSALDRLDGALIGRASG